MSVDAHLDMLSARVDTLESEVLAGTAAGAVGNDWSAADANGNPSVKDGDPKGRNIWEAQWSEDDKTLWCYVPECALIIDGNEVTVDVENGEDKKGDEIKLSEGVWYLQIFQFGDSASCSATFTVNPKQGDENLRYSIKIISVTKDGTVDNQYAVGAIVLNRSGAGSGNNDYFADERSISNVAKPGGGDPSQMQLLNFFYLNGFGTFLVRGNPEPIGFYMPPSSADVVMGEETEFAFLCRNGNSPAANSNSLTYKKLRLKPPGESPFQYCVSKSINDETGETVTLHELKHCFFYFNGKPVSLPDFDVSGLLGAGVVYLRGVQEKPSEKIPSPEWTWSIGSGEIAAPDGGQAQNIRLYEFERSKVKIDYRTTFLSLSTLSVPEVKIKLGEDNEHLKLTKDEQGNFTLSVPEIELKLGEDNEHLKLTKDEQGNLTLSVPKIESEGVLSLNGKYGHVSIGAGKGINVTQQGQRIVISTKEEDDDDPGKDTPCGHPESDGGVSEDEDSEGHEGISVSADGAVDELGGGCADCGGASPGQLGGPSADGGRGESQGGVLIDAPGNAQIGVPIQGGGEIIGMPL